MVVGDLEVVEGGLAGREAQSAAFGFEAEMFIQELVERVEIGRGDRLESVGDPTGIAAVSAGAEELRVGRDGDEDEGDVPATGTSWAISLRLKHASSQSSPPPARTSLPSPKSLGQTLATTKSGRNFGPIFEEAREILLRGVADVPGIEDRDPGLPLVAQSALQLDRRRVAVADEHPLHERVAEDDPPDRRLRVGLGAA